MGGKQGTNHLSDDRKHWVVCHMVKPGDKEYSDALLAHELTHIILTNKGFNAEAQIETPEGTEVEENLKQAATLMGGDCFADDLVDRETAKRGFKPNLLVKTQLEWTEQIVTHDPVGYYENGPDLNKTIYAVELFCMGRRVPALTMHEFEKRVATSFGPTIMEREKRLSSQFQGRRCYVGDPSGCFKVVLSLRSATQMNKFIFFKNPKTGKWE